MVWRQFHNSRMRMIMFSRYNPTRHKLNEARYFLDQVKSSHEQYRRETTQEQFNILHYNLSAFFSAARSITFFMKKQYDKKPKFNEWYESKQKEMSGDSELKFSLDARNLYVHERIAETPYTVESIYIAKYELKGEIYELKDLADPSTPDVEFEGLAFSSGKLVDEFCSDQLEKLEIILKECEKKFL